MSIKRKPITSILLALFLISSLLGKAYAQTTYKIKKIDIQYGSSTSWREVGLYSPLDLYVDANRNITFSDYNMLYMELLAGKEYVGRFDALVFTNTGLEESNAEKSYDAYGGKLKLIGKQNFPETSEAFVKFMYHPNSKKVGIVEVSNYFCRCHIRLWIL